MNFFPKTKDGNAQNWKDLAQATHLQVITLLTLKQPETLGLDTGHKLVINTSRSCYSRQNFTLKTKKSLKKFLTVVPEKSLFTNIKQYVGLVPSDTWFLLWIFSLDIFSSLTSNVTLIFNIYFCTVNFKHFYIVSINFPCPTSPKKFPLLVHTKVILDIFWDIAWSLSLGFVSNHILVVLSTLWGQSVQWEDVIWKQPLFKTGKTIKWLCL